MSTTSVKVGDRIELVRMADDPDPIAPGERGTVDYVGPLMQGIGQRQVGVQWDSGRSLMVVLPIDVIRVIA